MPQPVGRNVPLSLPRRFICDLVHFAHKVPTVPVERRMELAAVVAARQAARPRPSWCALFTKAYAFVAAAEASWTEWSLSYRGRFDFSPRFSHGGKKYLRIANLH